MVGVDYSYPWAQLIQQWKFHDHPGFSRHFRQWFAPDALRAFLHPVECTVPIPLSAQRLRERGYNQALLLARALAAPQIQPALLERVRHTQPQAGQHRAERLRNLRGAFSVPPQRQSAIVGRHLLLVDDVITTGATVQAAAHALLQAGAASVRALALARTP